uniref:Disease resistance R13L4/SHOC-2-like LRR domain-containing protein n=1 Tax=viral metagenome TaxID=1070528 RepID=A0A6C0CB07_9ZZZZ
MNQDILLEIIQKLNHDVNNYALINKSYYQTCESFYSAKMRTEFSTHTIPNLSNRQIYFIFNKIKDLKKINDTDYNSITLEKKCFFPSILCKLVNLETLGLNFGRIKKIPPDISALVNLRTLNLSCNLISSFPNEILSLTKLEILNLAHNEIKVVPNIGNLTNLKILDLSNNDIQHFCAYDELVERSDLIINLEKN